MAGASSSAAVAPSREPELILPAMIQPPNFAGFIFDPFHFPFTLLENLTNIAKELRELGLEKTGGKDKGQGDLKYSYFEEAELAKHLVALLNKHQIGYAAGTSAITGRHENGKSYSGNTIWNHTVQSAAIFSHRESKEWLIVPGVGEANDNGDKGTTKAITSALKYVLMKSFLVSEGNDIEVDQSPAADGSTGQEVSPPPAPKNTRKAAAKTESKAQTTVVNKCGDCKGEIKAIQSNGKNIPAEIVAAKSKEKFGTMLCAGCAMKRGDAQKQPPQQQANLPEGRERIDTTIVKVKDRTVNTKRGKTTVYDLELYGGVSITDWHESHFEWYDAAKRKSKVPIEVIVDVKQNGKYVNRNVFALLSVDGECVEDEDGNKVEVEQEEQSFSGTDEDIPF